MLLDRFAKLANDTIASSRFRSIALVVVLLLVVVGIARCKTAWFDDTAYASKAVNWCLNGSTGTPIYPGTLAAEFSTRPGYAVTLGTFYKLFGIGFTQTRIFGLLCYLGLLAAGYSVFRQLGCNKIASQAAVLLLAIDPAMVWHVRAGRPDLPAAFLVAAGTAALLFGLKSSCSRRRVSGTVIGGICLVAAPLVHPYSVPAVGLVLLAFLIAAFRNERRIGLIAGLSVGCLIPTLAYGLFLASHWDAVAAHMNAAAEFLKEESTAKPGVLELLKEEITRRWVRSFLIEPFRLVMIAIGLSLLWRKSRAATSICLMWIVAYFLILWLKVPKDTHYQILQLALPTAVLIALVIDAALKGSSSEDAVPIPRRTRWVPALWLCSLLMGTALLSLFPVASVIQWDERSHAMLEQEVARVIPSGSIVAVDPSAYFASVANDCTTYYSKLLWRAAKSDEAAQLAFQRDLLTKHGVEYLVLYHESPPLDVSEVEGISLEPVETIGMERRPLPFARDPEYLFDVYRVVRTGTAADGKAR